MPPLRVDGGASGRAHRTVDVVIDADAAADPFAGERPLFDCRECGFEWGELVRDLMR